MRTLSDKIRITQKRIVRDAPEMVREMTNMARTYFVGPVFDRAGLDVHPNGRWKRRKKAVSPSRQLLVKSGRMRRSINAYSRGKVGVVSTDVPYAQYHQEGTKNMPQRKFMGDSNVLDRKFRKFIERKLTRAFNRV